MHQHGTTWATACIIHSVEQHLHYMPAMHAGFTCMQDSHAVYTIHEVHTVGFPMQC